LNALGTWSHGIARTERKTQKRGERIICGLAHWGLGQERRGKQKPKKGEISGGLKCGRVLDYFQGVNKQKPPKQIRRQHDQQSSLKDQLGQRLQKGRKSEKKSPLKNISTNKEKEQCRGIWRKDLAKGGQEERKILGGMRG